MKTIATITALSALALNGFSQGQVNFQNGITSQLYFNSTASAANKVTSGTIASQTEYGSTSTGVVDVGLYWSTAAFTFPSQGTLADVVTMSSTAGTFAGTGTGSLAIPGTFLGENIYVQVYAWDSTFANPDAALAADGLFAAWSAGPNNVVDDAIGPAQLVQNLTVAPAAGISIFGTGPGQFGRAVIPPLPEPGTTALGVVGVVAFMLFQRRK